MAVDAQCTHSTGGLEVASQGTHPVGVAVSVDVRYTKRQAQQHQQVQMQVNAQLTITPELASHNTHSAVQQQEVAK